MDNAPRAILCLASYEKGAPFLQECKRLGCQVILLTVSPLEHAEWPRESLDDFFHMPDLSDVDAVIRGVSYLARSQRLDRIVALDDYDVETAAALREHLRLPGMGASAARLVRDKLAMRVAAHAHGIPVPDFAPVFNYEDLRQFMARVPPPWVLKPRSHVSTIGIARIGSSDELWAALDALGDRQSYHLLERYVAGDVYHVDSIVSGGAVLFAEAHRYGRPPLDVFHGGGIFVTRTLRRGSDDEQALQELNRAVIAALGVRDGATHVEFIKGDDGRLYFLEIGARVGGAHTADMVEAATGINLWVEWARIEAGQGRAPYELPPRRHDYAGALISLARQEQPDTSAYTDPEIVLRVQKPHHVGFVLASPDPDRIDALLDAYAGRIAADFAATLPPWTDRPEITT